MFFGHYLSRPSTYICVYVALQVTGFEVNPAKPGKRFVEGQLVPCE